MRRLERKSAGAGAIVRLTKPVAPLDRPIKFNEKNDLSNTVRKGGVAKPLKGSTGLMALLRDTGALSATPDIRAIINEETSILSSQDQAFVDKLIFWVDDKEPGSIVVDAKKEQKRIQENQALGKPLNEGETPEIKRKTKRKGLLDF